MTIFGPDVSSYEHGLNIPALPYPFILAKVTEGTYYRDADWPVFRDAARAAGKILIGYHFVTDQDAAAQVANLAGWIGDHSIPLMWDWEPTGSSHPPLPRLLAVDDAARAAGLRPRLAYGPRWWWQQLGSPDLSPLSRRGLGVVSSNYPNPTIPNPVQDYAADGGDAGPGWEPYGGIAPLLWQFTDAGVDQQKMDFNAYRGTAAQLAAFLGTATPTSTGGTDVGTISPAIGQKWSDIAGEFPANGSFDNDTALIWADAGARAAALYARQARDAINALAAHVGAPAPAVDVQALAAALGPLLHPTTDVDAIVTALLPHVAVPDPKAFADALVSHIKVTSS